MLAAPVAIASRGLAAPATEARSRRRPISLATPDPPRPNLGTADLICGRRRRQWRRFGRCRGTGFGGLVYVDSPTPGSTLTAMALSLHAGADGGVGGDGAIGGRGGDANGGLCVIDISAGSANLGVFSSFARGVAGGGAGSGGVGGTGGDGFGGLVELNVTGTLAGTSYQGDASAYGGEGGAGTTQGAGGSAEGGSTFFNVYTGGDAALSGAVFLNASGVRGRVELRQYHWRVRPAFFFLYFSSPGRSPLRQTAAIFFFFFFFFFLQHRRPFFCAIFRARRAGHRQHFVFLRRSAGFGRRRRVFGLGLKTSCSPPTALP